MRAWPFGCGAVFLVGVSSGSEQWMAEVMKRRHISKKQRHAIFEAHQGVCHICQQVIDLDVDGMDIEHVIPLALGGADEPRNMRPAHRTCHSEKTKADFTQIAKAKRVAKKHENRFRPSRHIVPGSKASPWKKHLNGRAERRMPKHEAFNG